MRNRGHDDNNADKKFNTVPPIPSGSLFLLGYHRFRTIRLRYYSARRRTKFEPLGNAKPEGSKYLSTRRHLPKTMTTIPEVEPPAHGTLEFRVLWTLRVTRLTTQDPALTLNIYANHTYVGASSNYVMRIFFGLV